MKQIEIVTFHPEDESDLDLNAGLSLDIIAVHGLNGNQINTWTEPKSKKLWLRDFLPKDFRGARVMTFGYNATAAFENSVAGIKDHARGLLGALTEKRERNFESKRPLIFIGHSLGGLVIKQALVLAEQESPYKQIYNSTLGIIFFGTPHQGSNLANYATTITRTLLALAKKPNAELLESLRKGGPALRQLSEDWKAHHERRPYQIVSFYETRTMKGMPSLIVEKSSALLTPESEVPTFEDQIPVEATHRDICRFATPKSKTYKDVVRKIKRIQHGSEVQVKSEFYVVPHSTSTHFTGRNEVRNKLSDSLLSYQTSKAQQIFVLYGLGGSGKTQISLKFAEDNRDSFWGIFWIDASSEDTAREGFLNIARACKQKENVEAVKEWLSGKKHWLLILDNADNPNLDISSFFPSRDRGTILITTRNPDLQKYNTAGSYKVDKLDVKEAIDLLLKTAAIKDPQGGNVRQVAERIINELGRLALAINQAGAVIRQGLCSLDGFCDLFTKQKREVLELGRSIPNVEDYQYSIFTTWEISLEKISGVEDNSAKLALELLKIFSFMHFDSIRQETFKDAVENSMNVTDATIFKSSFLASHMADGWDGLLWGKAIKLLLAFSLITTSHSGLISMHPLVHLWSRERMPVLERTDACQTAMMTLGIAYTQDFGDEDKKRFLVPHIDSLLEYGDSQEFTSVSTNQKELSAAMVSFHMAYSEGGQFQKVSQLPPSITAKSKARVEVNKRTKQSSRTRTFGSGLMVNYLKALRLAQADLDLKKNTLDLQDVDLLLSTCHVGAILACTGHFRESAELLEALMKDMPENIHYQVFLYAAYSLGCSYNRLEEYQASFDLCTNAMARYESVFAGEGRETVGLYNVMGETLCGLGRPKEGLIWATKAVLDAQKVWGPTHPKTCKAMAYLARVYECLRDFRNAVKWREKCIICLKACLGPNHPETIYAEGGLIDIFTLQRRNFWSRKTIIGRRRALFDKTTEQLGENDWQTLAFQEQLAKAYFGCGWFKKAKCVQEKWVEVMTQNFGPDDKRTMRGMAELARTNQWIAARKAMYWWLPQNFYEKLFAACGDVP